jgi:hypothetical protein
MFKRSFILLAIIIFMLGCNANKKGGSNATTNTVITVNSSLSKVRLLDKNQIVRSLYSVAGIKALPTDSLEPPKLAADTNNLSNMTAPMILALGSAISNFCNILRVREENAVGGINNKKFLAYLLSSTIKNESSYQYVETLSEENFDKTLSLLSHSFWGRAPTDEEALILKEDFFSVYQTELASATNATERQAKTKRLGMFLCISMLSSFDSYTY